MNVYIEKCNLSSVMQYSGCLIMLKLIVILCTQYPTIRSPEDLTEQGKVFSLYLLFL
jgi:hypothetical protein